MHERVIDGRYRLIEPLGAGGAAEVWRVHDEVLGVERALKLLIPREAARPTARRRLRAEADALASISHPNVLRILDLGTFEQRDYLVVELMPAGSLGDRVLARGCLSLTQAIERTVEALAGLAAAHAVGIVHRDVKPTNLLLGADGRAVVADFGIALLAEGERRTRTGVSMGSFAFMPPEQRLDAKSVGPTADIYATGATLFWLVTGRTPVDLFTVESDSERFAGLDPALVAVIRKATRAEPSERYASCAAMAADLLELVPHVATLRPDLAPASFPEPVSSTLTLAADPDVPSFSGPPRDTARRGLRVGALLTAILAGAIALVLLARLTGAIGSHLATPGAGAVDLADILSPLDTATPLDPAPANDEEVAAIGQPPDSDLRTATTAPPEDERTSAERAGTDRTAAILPRRWRGRIGDRDCTLVLAGADDALRGTFAVTFRESSVETAVSGTYDPQTGRLRLRDLHDSADAGRYDMRNEGRTLRGTFIARSRNATLPLHLAPEDR